MMNLLNILLVGAGGALGSMARYATVFTMERKLNSVFPYGTLAVNLVGSFVFGFILGLFVNKTGHGNWRLFLGTGFCGGFTTFSAFAFENTNLLAQKIPAAAVLYVAFSVAGGVAAAWAGLALAKNVF